jgi:guanine deaminase
MSEAIDLAVASVAEGRGGPFAALVVREGRVIAAGTNLVVAQRDPTAHAEVVAVREACRVLDTFQLTGCAVFSSCEPCPMCLAALYWARVERFYYAATREDAARAGFDDALIYAELARPAQARRLPATLLPHPRALGPFAAWARSPQRVPY